MTGNRLTIGNVTVLSLSDGHMDGTVRDMYGDEVTRTWGCGCVSPEAEPEFSTNLGSFLIRSGGQTIMVDTGMGDVEAEGVGGEWGSLFNEMKANKVDAGDVDMVFMTHLHFDHTGWNVSRNGGVPAVLFPKARYVAHEIDWEFFRNEPEAKEKYFYEASTVEPLYEMGKLELVSGHGVGDNRRNNCDPYSRPYSGSHEPADLVSGRAGAGSRGRGAPPEAGPRDWMEGHCGLRSRRGA